MFYSCQREKVDLVSLTFQVPLVLLNHAFQFYFTLIPRMESFILFFFPSSQILLNLLLLYCFRYLLLYNITLNLEAEATIIYCYYLSWHLGLSVLR